VRTHVFVLGVLNIPFFFPRKVAEKGLSTFSLLAHAASSCLPVFQVSKGSGCFFHNFVFHNINKITSL